MAPVTYVLWVAFTSLGQGCLLLLLGTFVLAKSLPQRNNPFLVNFSRDDIPVRLPSVFIVCLKSLKRTLKLILICNYHQVFRRSTGWHAV